MRRTLWLTIGQPLFRISFRTAIKGRCVLLRMFGAKISANVNIYSSATVFMPWNLEIGMWSSVGEHAYIYNLGKVVLGESVTISQRAHLCAGTHDYTNASMPLQKLPIHVENQVWICADAFIGPNLTLHEGSVVGARAVVHKDVDSWNVVAGNPAEFIKKRELKA